MKIQTQGGSSLILSSKGNQMVFNPSTTPKGESDFVALSVPGAETDVPAKKVFNTPGEFEVSGILAQGFFTDERTNVVYKAVLDDLAVAYFGALTEVPGSAFFEALGENVDVAVIPVTEQFDDKKAKGLIDKIDPRMAIIIGDSTYFAGMTANAGAKVAEENPMTVSKSLLSDDKTDVIILNSN